MTDLVVIGGGAMGLGVAWRCAARGMQVVVLEASARAGHEATGAAAGMLAPTAEVEFDEDAMLALGEESRRRWPTFASELESASGIQIGHDPCGSLIVAIDRDDAESHDRLFAYQRSKGMAVERLTGAECREREPLLSPRVHSGVWSPDDHQVDNRALASALVTALDRAGGTLRLGCRVERVEVATGAVRGVVLEGGERLSAARVLVAAGAWSRQVAIDGRAPAPVRPVKGQMLALAADPEFPLRHVIRTAGVYIAPKHDRWVVGATTEDRAFDRRVTAGGLYALLDGAQEAVPVALELAVVETWCGFRPASRDNRPILGPCEVEGLFFCTGHNRNGIQQTPVSVDAVSSWILGDGGLGLLEPFHIARFTV